MEKKAKNILFRIALQGDGIVNFDGGDQKSVFAKSNSYNMKCDYGNNNTTYAKKKFYASTTDDEKDMTYKVVISSDCLRHDIFKGDVMFQTPNIIHDKELLHSFIASPAALIRGYLFAEKETLKRKGALTITDAEQDNSAISNIDVKSRSGEKTKKETPTDKSDTSFFKKENIGKTIYTSIGGIDLAQLSFISCDAIFDRMAFNPDNFKLYRDFLKHKVKDFNSELGYFQMLNSISNVPELGVKLTDLQVLVLVRGLFERLLSVDIRRNNAYARTSKLEYKIVYDVIEDTLEDEDGWISIKSRKDLEDISFDLEAFYYEVDFEKAKKLRQSLVDVAKAKLEENKNLKALKAEEIKKNKAEKKAAQITNK